MANLNHAMSDEIADRMSLASHNYRLAPDWERHDCTVVAFPDRDHPRFHGRSLPDFDKLRKEIVNIFKHISHYELIKILGSWTTLPEQKDLHGDPDAYSQRNQHVVDFVECPDVGVNMDIRYSAPLVVIPATYLSSMPGPQRLVISNKPEAPTANAKHGQHDSQSIAFDWEYCQEILEVNNKPQFITLDISYDSSAFVHDGAGTFILSTALLRLWPQSQIAPKTAKQLVQINMEKYMEAKTFIWVEQTPEETDRPLSTFCRFVQRGHLLLSRPAGDDKAFPYYEFSLRVLNAVDHRRDHRGNKEFVLSVVEEAHPSSIPGSATRKITRCHDAKWPLLSYLTYIHVKDGVLFPRFGDEFSDENARSALRTAFEGKCAFVHSVRVHELPYWGSSLHSITQHVPFDFCIDDRRRISSLMRAVNRDEGLRSPRTAIGKMRRHQLLELLKRHSEHASHYTAAHGEHHVGEADIADYWNEDESDSDGETCSTFDTDSRDEEIEPEEWEAEAQPTQGASSIENSNLESLETVLEDEREGTEGDNWEDGIDEAYVTLDDEMDGVTLTFFD